MRPATCNRMDLMHIVFSNGVLGAEVMLFLRSLKDSHGFYFEEVRTYMADWRCPWIQKLEPADCFNVHRASAKPALWIALAPKGCPKCAWKVKGCTPSCWVAKMGRLPKQGEHYVIARGFNRRVCSSGVNRQMPLAAVSTAKCVPVPFLACIR